MSENLYSTINFIRHKFKDYYNSNYASNIVEPSKREFGIGEYGKKISSRHLFFGNLDDFNKYLITKTPFFVSYSVGYYKFPDRRPMENKQWYGADIVYEFDSDDFDLPCHDKHNVWVCKNPDCKKEGYGNLERCPNCESQTKIIQWTCDECLNKAKTETLRLADFLENEFKLDPSTFIISFSGSKGYHLRITDKSIISLSKSSRLELMNYILGNDLNLEKLGFIIENKAFKVPSFESLGWSKKILNKLLEIIKEFDSDKLSKEFYISKRKANIIFNNKEDILKKLYHNNILWNDFTGANDFWKDVISFIIKQIRLKIDPQSSSDIYKIMRVPDTIHGGTGFLSNSIKSIDDLKKFDAFSDPVILNLDKFKKVKLKYITPKFRIKDEFYGPFEKNQIIEVKEAVAIFLVLKGVANFE